MWERGDIDVVTCTGTYLAIVLARMCGRVAYAIVLVHLDIPC